MRVPRPRFTIGGLMALVLFASLGLWVRVQVISRSTPSIPERAALAAYEQSKLTREVAEVAVLEFVTGLFNQDSVDDGVVEPVGSSYPDIRGDMPIIRWKGDRLPRSNSFPDRDPKEIPRRVALEKQIEELKAEVAKVKADEAGKLERYNAERARRTRLFGIR